MTTKVKLIKGIIALYFFNWAIKLCPGTIMVMAERLMQVRNRQMMDERGIERMELVQDEMGRQALVPIFYGHDNPTKH